MHDDYYVLVDHDDYYVLMGHDVLVVFITSNKQLICRFYKLLVTDDAMMMTISLCVGSSSLSSFVVV